ncbi:MAG: ATP-binding protein [Planctomycetes bacterium]|nr:ATP-binding protein [Planctomycetota bacterium]
MASRLIQVITGPRRAGKSTFCLLLLRGQAFAYLNFDDEQLARVENYDDLVESIYQVYGDPKYLFFDEIQNLPRWELFVNKLYRRGHKLILTGSNSKLLSKELGAALTGRYLPFQILPVRFQEIVACEISPLLKTATFDPKSRGKIMNRLLDYLISGGFPEVVFDQVPPKPYLETLFDAILLKDVVKRYKVKSASKLYHLALYLINNLAGKISFNKLGNILGLGSPNTAQNYVRYLEEAYLTFTLNRFSTKFKEQIKSPRKIYVIDNGFILAKAFQLSKNYGRLMENLVFVELMAKGFKPNLELFYYRTASGHEVDFMTTRGHKIDTLIQVTYDLSNQETEERELSGLLKASSELKCRRLLIITWDIEATKVIGKKKVQLLPLWKWLLDPNLKDL